MTMGKLERIYSLTGDIIRMYRDEHKSMDIIAARLGIHKVTVRRALVRNDIPIRPRGRYSKKLYRSE